MAEKIDFFAFDSLNDLPVCMKCCGYVHLADLQKCGWLFPCNSLASKVIIQKKT